MTPTDRTISSRVRITGRLRRRRPIFTRRKTTIGVICRRLPADDLRCAARPRGGGAVAFDGARVSRRGPPRRSRRSRGPAAASRPPGAAASPPGVHVGEAPPGGKVQKPGPVAKPLPVRPLPLLSIRLRNQRLRSRCRRLAPTRYSSPFSGTRAHLPRRRRYRKRRKRCPYRLPGLRPNRRRYQKPRKRCPYRLPALRPNRRRYQKPRKRCPCRLRGYAQTGAATKNPASDALAETWRFAQAERRFAASARENSAWLPRPSRARRPTTSPRDPSQRAAARRARRPTAPGGPDRTQRPPPPAAPIVRSTPPPPAAPIVHSAPPPPAAPISSAPPRTDRTHGASAAAPSCTARLRRPGAARPTCRASRGPGCSRATRRSRWTTASRRSSTIACTGHAAQASRITTLLTSLTSGLGELVDANSSFRP